MIPSHQDDSSTSPDIHSSFYEDYTFFYLLEHRICSLCITKNKANSPSALLKELVQQFLKEYGIEAPLEARAMEYNKEFSSVVHEKITKCNADKSSSQLVPAHEGTFLLMPEQNGEADKAAAISSSSIDNPLELLVPDINPLSWTVVNLILLAWSVGVFWLIVATEEGVLNRPHGELIYLCWNFVSTGVWCAELGLVIWYHGGHSTMPDRIQLVAALYSLVDSIRLFRQWQNPTSDMDEELFDVILNSAMYLWITISTARQWRQRCKEKDAAAMAFHMHLRL